jgi:putative FmdB family regulatory protein
VATDGSFACYPDGNVPDNRSLEEDTMPIYEYACESCGKEFEALVRSETVPQCPVCQSTHLEKQLSVFATAGATTPELARAMAGPCGSCGHPDGPGSCRIPAPH